MTKVKSWQLLLVDDEQVICEQVKEFLEGESLSDDNVYPQVTTLNNFDLALETLETHRFDVVILDVRMDSQEPQQGDDAGILILNAIKQKCFIPIIFYTGIPHLVRNIETPLIRVVEKTEGLPRLLEVLIEVFNTEIPSVNRALIRHLETIQRDYMWDFVATHWKQFYGTDDRTSLAYLLARRLARSLSGSGIEQLAKELGNSFKYSFVEEKSHPGEYYIIPPINKFPLVGDLYCEKMNEGQREYYVLLTPSCDFIPRKNGSCKAEYILLAKCLLLEAEEEYIAIKNSNSNTHKSKLEKLLTNNREKQPERFYFLPGVFELPDLVIDFQQLVTLPIQKLNDDLERIASLDSPFAEALLVRFTRFFGRLGTRDCDTIGIFEKLRNFAEMVEDDI